MHMHTAAANDIAKLQSTISDAYFPYEITEYERRPAIHSTLETKNFGPLRFSHVSSDATYSGRRRKDGRTPDVFVLHLMEEGNVIFSQHRNKVQAHPGALVLINPDPILSTEKLTATEALAIPIPARLLTMHFPDARNWALSMRSTSLGAGAVLRDVLECCWRERNMVRTNEGMHMSKALIQLIGATFGRDDAHLASCGSRSMQLHYIRIRDLVFEHLDKEDLSADFVSTKLGISKSYLFAILKDANTTLGRFILKQRLERCREMLSDPAIAHVTISEIAYSAGFRELPHFSRSFAKHFGASPRAFRTTQLAQSAADA